MLVTLSNENTRQTAKVSPRTAAFIKYLIEHDAELSVERQGWVELHFDGTAVDARAKLQRHYMRGHAECLTT